jgi:hypothetical protein
MIEAGALSMAYAEANDRLSSTKLLLPLYVLDLSHIVGHCGVLEGMPFSQDGSVSFLES